MPITKTFNNTSYSIPLEGELNWATLSDFLVALADYGQTINKQKVGIRVATASPVTVLATTDCVIVTDLTIAGAVAVNLPAGVTGQVFTVVDGKGDAGTNNITITPAAGTINGAATYVIDSNRAGVSLAYNGTSWTVIAEFISSGDIPRNQIAAGTANHVIINDGSGDLSSEATLAKSRGGAGADMSSVTFPSSGTLVTEAAAQTLGSKTLEDATTNLVDTDDATKKARILIPSAQAGSSTQSHTLPAASSTLASLAGSETLTNKTLTSPTITAPAISGAGTITTATNITDTADATKKAVFSLGSATTAKTVTIASAHTVDRTITLPDATDTLVGKATTDTLTNKTLTSPTINTPVINQANMTQAASATTPAAGKSAVYVNSGDAKLHIVDSSGNDTAIGSGGAGSRNYLSDWFDGIKSVGSVTSGITSTGNITISTTLWQASDTTKLTVANVTSGGLRGDAMTNANHKCLKLDHVAVAAAFVQTPTFQLDPVDLGKPVSVTFDHGAVTTADDYQVYIVRYDSSGTYQEQIPIVGVASATSPYSARMAAGSTTSFRGFFVAGSTSTDYYALRFYRNSASDTTDINIDTLYVGPGSVMQGAAVTDWKTSPNSPTITGSTTAGSVTYTSQTAKQRRVGDSMEVEIVIILNVVTTAPTGFIKISSPFTESIDDSKFPLGAGTTATVGYATVKDASTLEYQTATVLCDVGNGMYLVYDGYGGADIDGKQPFTLENGDQFRIRATIPIANWSSNVTMADRAVEEYASNDGSGGTTANTAYDTGMQYGAGGSNFVAVDSVTGTSLEYTRYRVRFLTPIQKTDTLILELFESDTWIPVSTTSRAVSPMLIMGNSMYGMGIERIVGSTTDIYVGFGNKGRVNTNTTYAGNGATWSGVTASKWRVRKVSGGAAVGFPVSARNVVGDTSGQTVPSGYIGEKIELTWSSVAATTTGSYKNVSGALVLTPGVWSVSYTCLLEGRSTGITAGNNCVTYLYTTPDSGTGVNPGINCIYWCPPATRTYGNGEYQPFSDSGRHINISVQTSYYLNCMAQYTSTVPNWAGRLTAIRIA